MRDFMFTAADVFFIQAWKKWDLACARISLTAEVEARNGRRYYPPAMALQSETEALVEAKARLAEELGISHVHLMRALLELRHDGVDHAKCVRLVRQYLEQLSYATS